MVVHFMKDHASGTRAIRNLQSWTKPGGVNLVTGYMSNQPLPKEFSYLFGSGELSDLYKDWSIRWSQESFRLTLGRIYSIKDIFRLLLGKRGFKAARIIAQKS